MSIEQLKPDTFLRQRLIRISTGCALLVFITGMLVLAGWQWNIDFLKRPFAHPTAMNPLTALNLIVTPIAFLFLISSRPIDIPVPLPPSQKILTGRVLAAFLVLTGIIRIAGAFHLIDFSIDQVLFSKNLLPETGNLSPRMTMTTAFCFIMTGTSLQLLNRETKAGQMAAQYLAVLIGIVGLFSMIGYLYRVKAFYGIFGYTPMAIHTASCFLLISFALLFANPGKGIMQEITSSYTGGLMARRLLPLCILLPVLLGYLRLWGYWEGAITTEFGVTILVSGIVVIFVLVIGYNTRLLNKRDALKQESDRTLLESEERFRLLVSSIKDYAIFMVDPSGLVLSWNEGAEHIKGYKAEEIVGKNMSVFYTEEAISRAEPAQNLARALEHGRFEMEGLRVRKGGTPFRANIVITALYDPKGALLGFTKVTRDITEKKKSEDQIAYMARLLEDTNDAIFSTDSSFLIRTWNKAAELLFGYSLAEVKGKLASDILRTQTTEPIRHAIRKKMIQTGYWKGEVHYLNRNESVLTILLSASAVKDTKGELDGFVMVCRDFTERIKLERQLQQFNKDLEAQVIKKTAELTGIFERITDAFIAMDKNLCYTYLNKKAGELIHHDPASLIGKWVWDVFPDAIGSSTYLSFNKAMAEQKNMINIDYYQPLGLWQENHLYPSPEGLSVFIRDITEQKKTENDLQQSYEDIRQLASHLQDIREEERAGIAREIHDELGQQLTGIKMDLSWISKRIPNQECNDELRQKTRSTLDLLDITIKTVRRIATELRPSILDDLGLIAALEWQSQEFQKRSGISTEFISDLNEFHDSSSIGIGLFRICQESLTNIARHAEAGKVTISLQNLTNKSILLTIEDDGKGFQPDRVSSKKTLGLLGMKERTLMMGGDFSLTSQPGKGTTLCVTVPYNIH
jgi:PAS domain S-box-containing protein